MSRRGVLAGSVSGLAALLAAAGALAAAAASPASAGSSPAPSASAPGGSSPRPSAVVVPAGTTRLVCPDGTSSTGASRTAAGASATGLALEPGGSAASASDLVATATTPAGASGRSAATRALGQVLAATVPGASGGTLAAQPSGGAAPLLAGSATTVTTSGELRGLTSSACLEPSVDTWLVGGSLGTGRSLRLELADPGEAATTVSVTVLTASGPQQPAALQSLSLAPGQRRSVLLQGVVSPASGPVAVQVRSAGSPVAAWVREDVTSGVTAGGTDVVVPSAAPARTQLVTGLSTAAGQGDPVLRLAAPGTTAVVAHVSVLGANGSVAAPAASTTVAVQGGHAVDVRLHGVDPSAAAVSVTADGPVLAGLGLSTAATSQTAQDTAWAAAEPALSGATLVALPATSGTGGVPAQDERLVLAAGGSADGAVDVRVVGADGAVGGARRVQVAAGRTVSLALPALTGTSGAIGLELVPASGQLGAALVAEVPAASGVRVGDLLAVRPLRSPARTASSVLVHLSASL